MSTLRVTNVQDTAGGNSLTTAQIYNGAAKAWVNFNGTSTVAIRADFNVTSITDNGTGDYTVNLTTAMGDVNYSVVANGQVDAGAGGNGDVTVISIKRVPDGIASGSFRLTTQVNSNTAAGTTDCLVVTAAIFR